MVTKVPEVLLTNQFIVRRSTLNLRYGIADRPPDNLMVPLCLLMDLW
jgi:hypothetical protein